MKPKLGALGTFSQGKLSDDDEGDLQIGIASDIPNGVIRIEFGTPTTWVALPPEQAEELALILIARAKDFKS